MTFDEAAAVIDKELERFDARTRQAKLKSIAQYLRSVNAQRMRAQTDPDGQKWQGRAVAPKGGTLRTKMFMKLSKTSRLKMASSADALSVGFSGGDSRIAWVHQEGLRIKVNKNHSHRYAQRRLVGFSDADIQFILDEILN